MEIQQVIELGERNAEAIELIKRHCAHARVEPSRLMGHSMVEDMTGLPISGREMRCEYAPAPTSVGPELLPGAIAFYEENCVGCPHRQMQALPPNLKSVADAALEERDRQRGLAEQRARSVEDERRARSAERAERVASEPQATREMVRLLDGIDAEVVDGRAEELVDLCRLDPEICTTAAADVLLEVAAKYPRDPLFAALIHLDRAGKLDRDRLLNVAVDGLAQLPMNHAGELVIALQEGLAPGQLRPALSSIARLAAPPHDFGLPPQADVAILRVAAAHDLPGLLDELQAMIASVEQFPRRVGAGAAARLIEIDASLSAVLVRPLIDALSLDGSLEDYMGSPRGEIQEGLHSAFLADPEGTVTILEQRARGVSAEIQSVLFHVFDGAIRVAGKDGAISARAAEQAIEAAFRRLSGDWGDELAFQAAELVDLAAQWQPELMASRVDQLFGALITHTATPLDRPSVLEVPSSKSAPELQAWEAMGRRSTRAAIIRDLRQALGHLVSHAPRPVARNVIGIIEAGDVTSPEALELRDEAVRLLGDLGKRADMLNDVLPMLWTALLHGEQRVRAQAVVAWRMIAAVHGHALPDDLADLLPALLEDKYVVVHQAAFRALREGLPVSEAVLGAVVLRLVQWSIAYKQDSHVLDDILHALWLLSGRMDNPASTGLREHCLQLAEHLDGYDKERFIQWHARGAESLNAYPARLLEVVADARDRAGRRDDDLLRKLRALESLRLAPLATGIEDAARAHLPDDHRRALRFVEILQRAGRWTQALELSEEIVAAIPNTTEGAIPRDGALAVSELARAESALLAGRAADAEGALDAALEADRRQCEAWERQPDPWQKVQKS